MNHLRRALIATAILAMLPVFTPHHNAGATARVGPKTYYLALGDSLAYGFQPMFHFYHGYADDWSGLLRLKGMKKLVDYGCPGETVETFLRGGCRLKFLTYLRGSFYKGAQFPAALSFIRKHPGQVSPVSIDIGANNFITLFNPRECRLATTQSITSLITQFDGQFTNILTQLKDALHGTGDLFTMNYYYPYQNVCPKLVLLIQDLNQHLVNDAANVGVPVAMVYQAFGGPAVPNPNLCTYTWMCTKTRKAGQNIHPTDAGYQVIAHAFEQVAGY